MLQGLHAAVRHVLTSLEIFPVARVQGSRVVFRREGCVNHGLAESATSPGLRSAERIYNG
jgi:hypothetical protein